MTERPPRSRRERAAKGQGERLREELVEAAIELLGELGDARLLTLRGVARRAEVSAPSVYLHFADLDALVETVEVRLFAEFGEQLATAARATSTEAPPRAVLDATIAAYLAYADAEPLRYRVLFSQVRTRTPAGLSAGDPVFAALVAQVAACMDEADTRQPRSVAEDVWAALHGISSLRASFPGFGWGPQQHQIERIVSAILALPHGR